jgi:hypothetical protein
MANVEQGQITASPLNLELRPDRPDVLRAEWRLCANDLSLIPRNALFNVLFSA